ncbi:DEAD/DEAH box helicase family protein, partial [bacterium]|nr:DEAD/DEAH box helicase family protein [bacterium]
MIEFSRDTEADTCRKYVLPVLYSNGWDDDHIAEQHYITSGKIQVVGNKHIRMKGKKPDYILLHTPDYPIAVIEAKAFYKKPSDGLSQAKEYAEMLDVKFAYSTNGNGIVEFDYTTGKQSEIDRIPTPENLWKRYSAYREISDKESEKILYPNNRQLLDWDGKPKKPRYYQQVAINRACEAIFKGRKKALLTMATGTGKTFTAMQIIWKAWDQKWNLRGKDLHPKILYLADRNILVDEPRKDYFDPVFGNAVHKISGEAVKGREIYFGIYQALADREDKVGLYSQFDRDFFDLIIVDECHRGSAREDSTWREILEYFQPATQIGMTATPRHTDNIDTYKYFGEPIYTYSLKQGIVDGFLAPYRVKRVVMNVDAKGLRFPEGTLDKYGNEIPDKAFSTSDYERILCLASRNEIAAKYIVDYLNEAGIYDNKTIIFCVDQEHAEKIRDRIREIIPDVLIDNPDFCERVTSDEGNIGLNHLGNFKDVEKNSPGILTSSQMLTTGVDMPTVKNVILFAKIESLVTFKQIIGRGTRIREDKDKLWFTIIDFTGATELFAEPKFDGPSEHLQIEIINDDGEIEDVWA